MSQGNLFDGLESLDSARTNEPACPKPASADTPPCSNDDEVDASDRTCEVGKTQPPPFPVDAFPPWLRDMISGIAIAMQTPVDLPAIIGLGLLSLACARKFKVEVRRNWTEPLSLFCAIALPVASRKSPVFDAMTAAVLEFEAALFGMMRPVIAAAKAERHILEMRLQKLSQAAAKGDDLARQDALELSIEIDKKPIPEKPHLFTQDVTPEGIVRFLEEQEGRSAVLSDEGGELIEIMCGRYSKNGQSHMEVFLKCHAGSPVRVFRADRTRPPISIDNPKMTLVLCLQPIVMNNVWQREDLNERGMIARFLWSVPPSPLGNRKARPPDMPEHAVEKYTEGYARLLDACCSAKKPVMDAVLILSSEAREILLDLVDELEPGLGQGGRYEHMAGWVGKLAGAIARIAGLLHIASAPERVESAHGEVISEETMISAIRIGRYYLAHAERAYTIYGSTADKMMQARILGWIRQNGIGCFSERDLVRALGVRKEHIIEPLSILQDGGYIEESKQSDPAPSGRPGRKPSRQWRVLPLPKLITGDSVDSVNYGPEVTQ